jgi:uncharacterized membrane protein YfcA
MGIGLIVAPYLTALAELETLLGGLLVVLASRELGKSSNNFQSVKQLPSQLLRGLEPLQAPIALSLGGVVHSLLAVGGPFVVLGLQPLRLAPEVQRITLAALWLLLNTVLLGWRWHIGLLTAQNLQHSLWLLPGVVSGIVLGEWLARHIKGEQFRRLVWLVLLAAGVKLLVEAWV